MRNINTSVFGIVTIIIVIIIAFTTCKEDDDLFVAVSGISGVPSIVEVNIPITLRATVSPSDATNQTIVWTVKDAGSTGASITNKNTLTATVEGTTIITATIINGASKSTPFTSDFTISVKTDIAITSVTVSPATSEVPRGYSSDFTAIVVGNNLKETDKEVRWSITGSTSQKTTINTDGTLNIAENETAETLIVTATSIVDNSISGTATVTVYDYQNTFDNNFDNAEIVEFEYMGEKNLCYYIDGKYIIEGDVVIFDENYQDIETTSNDISTRAAMSGGHLPWEEGKVYYFRENNEFNSSLAITTNLYSAINEIRSATNNKIKFIELLTPEARAYKKNTSIKIIPNDTINVSNVGWVRGGQSISLKVSDPQALHEICHALGLIHEHVRPDRDNHIIVHTDRADPNFVENNFNIWKWGMMYESAFDIHSIMMYPSTAYAIKAGQKTITNLDGSTIYRTYNLSDLDKVVLNKIYTERNAAPDAFLHIEGIVPEVNSCVLTGELIYEGYPAITEYGIAWSEYKKPETLVRKRATTKDNVGRYEVQLTNLKPNTTYEAWTYTVQDGKTTYGKYSVLVITKAETPSHSFDQWWNLREYKAIITYSINEWEIGKNHGAILKENGDDYDYEDYFDRPSNIWSLGINGRNYDYESEYFWTTCCEEPAIDVGNDIIKYSGTVHTSDFISGTYTLTRWESTKRKKIVLISTGRFELWKIDKPIN